MKLLKHKKKDPAGGAQPYRLPTLTCMRCGHSWHPKMNRRPIRCAKCKSPYWERERELSKQVEAAENEGLAVEVKTEEAS